MLEERDWTSIMFPFTEEARLEESIGLWDSNLSIRSNRILFAANTGFVDLRRWETENSITPNVVIRSYRWSWMCGKERLHWTCEEHVFPSHVFFLSIFLTWFFNPWFWLVKWLVIYKINDLIKIRNCKLWFHIKQSKI